MLGTGETQFKVSRQAGSGSGLCRLASNKSTVYRSTSRLGECAMESCKEGKIEPGRQNRTGGKHLLSLASKCIPPSFPLPIILEGLGFND